jgi:hypothetical protein
MAPDSGPTGGASALAVDRRAPRPTQVRPARSSKDHGTPGTVKSADCAERLAGLSVQTGMRLCVRPLLLLALLAACGSETPPAAVFSGGMTPPDEVERLVPLLAREDGRAVALERLVELAGIHLFQTGGMTIVTGDPEADDLGRRARRALFEHADLAVVEAALASENPPTRGFGIRMFGSLRIATAAGWRRLLPVLNPLFSPGARSVEAHPVRQAAPRRTDDLHLPDTLS